MKKFLTFCAFVAATLTLLCSYVDAILREGDLQCFGYYCTVQVMSTRAVENFSTAHIIR